MTIAVTRTKIRIPRKRADLFSRPRLNSLIDDLLEYPFTLISAPAGYGKTCLMIDLAHLASYPVCWYSLDPLDIDPKRFLFHFIHSIKMEFPYFGQPSIDLLENLPEPLNPPDQFISTLINDIYKSIQENFAIFIDDYHLVDEQQEIKVFLSKFGQQMDENTHLVISSRRLFNIPSLPLLIGRMQVKGIDQDDLSFQPVELREFFQEKLQAPISEKESVKMVANTSGWITGLLLQKTKSRGLYSMQDKAFKVSGADLESYFFEVVYKNQPEAYRNLMLKTSLFDEFNIDLCREVLGEPSKVSWSAFFIDLIDNNLFIEQIEDDGTWIRYHHLFRDFLKDLFFIEHNEFYKRIQKRLAEKYIESKDWEKAFEIYQQLEDPFKMAQLIKLSFGPLFHAGRIKLLSVWLKHLSKEAYLDNPFLHSLYGFTLTELGQPNKGLCEINKAIDTMDIQLKATLLAKSLIWRSTANRMLGNYDHGIADSFEAIKLLINETKVNQIKAEAYREIGLGFGRIGSNTEALDYLKKAYQNYKVAKINNSIAQVQIDIGLVLLNMGNFKEAETYFKSAMHHWSSIGNNIQLSIIMNNLGFLSTLTGNYTGAEEYFNKGEKHATLASSRRMQAFIMASRGDLYHATKYYIEAINQYNRAKALSEEICDSFLTTYTYIAKATSFRHYNEPIKAKEILLQIQKQVTQGASKFELGLWQLEWGFINLDKNIQTTAHEAFQTAQEIFTEIGRPNEEAKSLLGLCLASNIEENNNFPKNKLLRLIRILTELETIHPLIPEFSQHQTGIENLITYLPNEDILENCLDQVNYYHNNLNNVREDIIPQPTFSTVPLTLEIKAFKKINVKKGGKKISVSEWIHQKTVREIFFYLLSHPGGVTKQQVGLAFWPESSLSQLSCQFKNAMYRLRRSLGTENILYHQETRSYSFNWNSSYIYDVEQFQEVCRLAERQSDQKSGIDYLIRAVSIYQHPYASELDGIWAVSERRKLYLMYENAQLELANCFLGMENYTACRDCCLTILDIEPCQENATQLGMKAYSGLNNHTEIRRLYAACKENFQQLYGIRPSNITRNLYQDLISQ